MTANKSLCNYKLLVDIFKNHKYLEAYKAIYKLFKLVEEKKRYS